MGLLTPQAMEYLGLLGQSMLGGQSPNAGVNISQAMMFADQDMRKQAALKARLDEERQQAQMRDMQMQQMQQAQAAAQAQAEARNRVMGQRPDLADLYTVAPQEAIRRAFPEPQKPKMVFAPNGQAVDMNAIQPGQSFAKPQWIDAGDKVIPVGPDGQPTGPAVPKRMAPGEAQRIGMDRARLGMEAGRYNYEVGGGQGLPQKQLDAISAESMKDRAKEQFKAQNELPQVEAEAKQTMGLVDKMIKHPGFSTVVGAKGPTGAFAAAGAPIPGTDAADFTVLRNQLVGKQFLQAFQTLKGGGQITEVEGKKATDAIARMDTAQSEKEFIAAAMEFRGVIEAGLKKARAKAGKTGGWSIQKVD